MGYWDFEDGSNEQVVLDLSGNDNHAIIIGNPVYSLDTPNQTCSQINEEEYLTENSQMLIGDVNCDSLVNEVDAQAILEYTYTNGATPLPCDTIVDCSCNESLEIKHNATSKYGKCYYRTIKY